MEATVVQEAAELTYSILRQEPEGRVAVEMPQKSSEPEPVHVPSTPEELLERRLHARLMHIHARIRLVLTQKLECPYYASTSIHLALLECLARGKTARTLSNQEIIAYAVEHAFDDRIIDLMGHLERDFLLDSKRKKDPYDTMVFRHQHRIFREPAANGEPQKQAA